MIKVPNVKGLASIGKAFVMANRPELLFGASIVSTVAAVVTAGIAGYKSGQKVLQAELDVTDEELDIQRVQKLDVKEKIQLTWMNYLPAAGLTGAALGSTTGLHLVHVKEKKALAAAALMAIEEVRKEAGAFKDDVVKTLDEKLSPKKAEDVIEAVEEKQMARMVDADQLYLVRDEETGRPFYSTENKIQNAINEVNRMLQSRDVSLNDFYIWAGIPEIQKGEEIGWNSGDFIIVKWDDSHLEDGRPVRAFSFHSGPTRGFDNTHK